jgi:hypothetical protein
MIGIYHFKLQNFILIKFGKYMHHFEVQLVLPA